MEERPHSSCLVSSYRDFISFLPFSTFPLKIPSFLHRKSPTKIYSVSFRSRSVKNSFHSAFHSISYQYLSGSCIFISLLLFFFGSFRFFSVLVKEILMKEILECWFIREDGIEWDGMRAWMEREKKEKESGRWKVLFSFFLCLFVCLFDRCIYVKGSGKEENL